MTKRQEILRNIERIFEQIAREERFETLFAGTSLPDLQKIENRLRHFERCNLLNEPLEKGYETTVVRHR